MVISVEIHNCIVQKRLVDQGSSADILYCNTFKQLGIPEVELIPYNEPLVGFSGERVQTKGYIKLSTASTLTEPKLETSQSSRIITIHADQKAARECYFASLRLPHLETAEPHRVKRVHTVVQELDTIVDFDPQMEQDERVEPIEERQPIIIGSTDLHVTYLGSNLYEIEKHKIGQVVRKNKDLFVWRLTDMPGIDPNFLCHKLSVYREAKPVAQQKRKTGEERKKAVEEKVSKLLEAGFIREIQYTTWLANVVMVKKSNGKWRMCTDYTDLNKACPKDAYLLPNIDRLVDGATGHKFLTFLDAYSGYNKICMHPRDEEKMALVTESANYCY
ncbi:uncharacterized protein LOC109789979 [Cajanus cajan]|uniref:uncharacterized protein LOC109789979 n=1 Tax=Cajanus cajan TaxID=3821 RepID=UPI00098DA94A|nr:uncharacterized protein LOC109789979 [Cajanus cajan]